MENVSKVKSAIEAVCQQQAHSVQVQFVLAFAKLHSEPSMLLPQLMLCDLVTKASFGMCPEEIADRVEEFIEQEWHVANAGGEQRMASGPLLWHELIAALQSAPLTKSDQHRNSGDSDDELDETGTASSSSLLFIQMLMREGVHLHVLRDFMLALARIFHRSCYGVEQGFTTFDEVYEHAGPLFSRQHKSAATVLELLNLIELVRNKPHIMMSNQKHSGQYAAYVDAFSLWLSFNPAIQRYLDPHAVLIQPSHLPAPPNVGAIIAALPVQFPSSCLNVSALLTLIVFKCLSCPDPVNLQVPNPDGKGAAISNIFTLPSGHDAVAFAVAARQHYAGRFGGGGPLEAHDIIHLSTTAGGFSFW
jgi:hypothetical protein